ncbi:hypothetical protein GCM10012275_22670 [Longimycelium tulufanense]|uniref:N-acetyltransferase domain-containing protein n=1 Tax=Longimycelium tulufanense TaxID=907463 RepID=A0A8J3C7Y3_9PSEU|nr:hypothetical protein [Longimycelium tulufanense]GGM51205.1 hypothetical protein GCM10012275_22670 [Longimycelium tulufanense]
MGPGEHNGNGLRVTTGTDARNLRDFVKVWDVIYADDPYAVRAFPKDVIRALGRTDRYLSRGHREVFILRSAEGRPLARAVAWFDPVSAHYFDAPTGFFSHFECVESVAAAKNLLAAVSSWLSGLGAQQVIGPMSPKLTDARGVLVTDPERPLYGTPYNLPYYPDLLAQVGLSPIQDLLRLTISLADDYPQVHQLADQAKRRLAGLVVREVRTADLENEVRTIVEFYNRTWVDNWDFLPQDPDEFWEVAREFRRIYRPEYGVIAEVDGEIAGVLITAPDVNQVLHPMRGRLWPLGWRHLVRKPRRIREFQTIFMGIDQRFRFAGIEAVLISELWHRMMSKHDVRRVHATWILESNTWMRRLAERVAGPENIVCRRSRIYRGDIANWV